MTDENEKTDDGVLESQEGEILYDAVHYSGYELDANLDQLENGSKEASYLLGYIGTLNQLDLSEKNLMEIIKTVIVLNHEREITKMTLDSQERISQIESKKDCSNSL